MVADAKEQLVFVCVQASDTWWSGLSTKKKNFGALSASSDSA